MVSISCDEVIHVAKLSNLNLTPEEIPVFQKQLSETLEYISLIAKLEGRIGTADVTYQVTPLHNVYREDQIDLSRVLSQDAATKNSRRTYNGYFVVHGIFREAVAEQGDK